MPAPDPNTEDPSQSHGSEDPGPSRLELRAPTASSPNGIDFVVDLVLNVSDPDPPLTGWLDEQLQIAAELAGVGHAQLTLVVVGDDEMAQLHRQYTGVTGTTDVLTFDLSDADTPNPSAPSDAEHSAPAIEGDIVVCLDEATRQANGRSHPVRHELLLYAVHGLMHLLGEDDHEEDDYQRMHAREDALLQRMGFAPLFDPGRNKRRP